MLHNSFLKKAVTTLAATATALPMLAGSALAVPLPLPSQGVFIERVANGITTPGTGFALNLYNLNSRVNLYDLKAPDYLEQWNIEYLTGVTPQIGFPSSSRVRIKSRFNSNYCMTATSAANNASIYVRPCGQANQVFIQDSWYNGAQNDSRFKLENTNSCINAPNVNLWNGGYVFMYACNRSLTGDYEQVFRVRN